MRLSARLGSLQTAVMCCGELVPARIDPPRLRTPRNILDLLEDAAAAVQVDLLARPAEKARALSRLAAVALKAIEVDNLVARVELLETVLKQRQLGGGS
jgi:hypothetical protein